MLYPQNNCARSVVDLSGIWKFKIDPLKIGEDEKWYNGFESDLNIAVPGSWNEMLEEENLLDYTGTAWFLTKSFIPKHFEDNQVWLRVGSADYNSKVWINGKYAGSNENGYLPYEFNITNFVEIGTEAEIVILVNNELSHETIPQGITSEQYKKEGRAREETYPPARFDFSPNGGIHRPVKLHSTPNKYIDKIKVNTTILSDQKGKVEINIETANADSLEIKVCLSDKKKEFHGNCVVRESSSKINLEVDNCTYWSTKNPYLYKLKLELYESDLLIDEYTMKVGIREIKIEDNKLLLNGEEIYLTGFGKHEDFWVIGKGLFTPLLVKDFNMMKWINANSFRTSHYPYAEEIMNYADEKGILVIDEVPAVSLDLRVSNNKTLENHKSFIKKLIDRDYNHPSVIMWAVGNEPNLVGAESYYDGRGRDYWKEIFDFTRTLDDTRMLTVPNCQNGGINDPVLEFSDVLSINRYFGWYENPGCIDEAIIRLEKELDSIYEKYKKPVLLTEFGADTLAGLHSVSDQMFTEEYQSKLITKSIELFRTRNYIIGEQLWNFSDFRTPMHFEELF